MFLKNHYYICKSFNPKTKINMDKLMEYMFSREAGQGKKISAKELQKHNPGPVITISREFGCKGSTIGYMLVDAINRRMRELHRNDDVWQFISKEVMAKAAEELKTTPEQLNEASLKDNSGFFASLTSMFANSYYSDGTKVKNTIAKYIYDFAEHGNTVIIGRGAEAITKDIKRGVRVKLVAPLEIRAHAISLKENISLEAAKKRCEDEDQKRAAFRRYFESEQSDLQYFDCIYNTSKMTTAEVVESILILAETRGFF